MHMIVPVVLRTTGAIVVTRRCFRLKNQNEQYKFYHKLANKARFSELILGSERFILRGSLYVAYLLRYM